MENVGEEKGFNILLSDDITERAQDFRNLKSAGKEQLFFELCFCILAANTSAELGIRMQETLGMQAFLTYDQMDLRNALKLARYRFYNTRSAYIYNSRWIVDELPDIVNSANPAEAREYLVREVYGIGYKEASHFLRNVGVFDFAILDKHILRYLGSAMNIKIPRSMTAKRYLEIEEKFVDMSMKLGLEPGILDLILWKQATGKVLK